MNMLGGLPISAWVQGCLGDWRLDGQCHQKHLLELGVWGLEVAPALWMVLFFSLLIGPCGLCSSTFLWSVPLC